MKKEYAKTKEKNKVIKFHVIVNLNKILWCEDTSAARACKF